MTKVSCKTRKHVKRLAPLRVSTLRKVHFLLHKIRGTNIATQTSQPRVLRAWIVAGHKRAAYHKIRTLDNLPRCC